MEFDQEEIQKLKPEDRIEVQEYYIIRFNYKFKTHEPERRKPPKQWRTKWSHPWTHRWGNAIDAHFKRLEGKKRMTTFVRRKK